MCATLSGCGNGGCASGKHPLGREEAILLAGYLSVPSPAGRAGAQAHGGLRQLSLMNSPVGGTGIAALADSLHANTSLLSLDLVCSLHPAVPVTSSS